MQVTTKDRGFVRSVEEQNLRRKAEAQAAVDARIRSDAEFAAGDIGSTPTTINLGLTPEILKTTALESLATIFKMNPFQKDIVDDLLGTNN
jgi:hypothetical protein